MQYYCINSFLTLQISSSSTQDEKNIDCRKHCAFNLPAMFAFVSPEDIDTLLTTLDALGSDHFYMVRKTVAYGIHEVRSTCTCQVIIIT